MANQYSACRPNQEVVQRGRRTLRAQEPGMAVGPVERDDGNVGTSLKEIQINFFFFAFHALTSFQFPKIEPFCEQLELDLTDCR
jgi:hypothetical protein